MLWLLPVNILFMISSTFFKVVWACWGTPLCLIFVFRFFLLALQRVYIDGDDNCTTFFYFCFCCNFGTPWYRWTWWIIYDFLSSSLSRAFLPIFQYVCECKRNCRKFFVMLFDTGWLFWIVGGSTWSMSSLESTILSPLLIGKMWPESGALGNKWRKLKILTRSQAGTVFKE